MKFSFRKSKKYISLFSAAVLILTLLCSSMNGLAESGTVNTDRLNLRSGPGSDYTSIRMLSTNTRVEILGSSTGSDGYTWYQVSTSYGNGWLRSDFVNVNFTYNAADTDFEVYLTQQGFPESYKNALRGLHQKYPNWIFVAQHTGLDWSQALKEESKIGRNLVYTSNPSSWKSIEDGAFDWAGNYWPGFDGSTWVAASSEIIAHYMDPRNFLTDPYIFQFQLQTYDSSLQTKEGLLGMVEDTFLSGTVGQKTSSSSRTAESYGPGYVSNTAKSGSSSDGPSVTSSDSSASGSSSGTVDFTGPVAALSDQLFSLFGGIRSYAAWEKTENNSWIWLNSDGSRNANGWFWLDGNQDGVSECYYFDSDGIMAADTVIDGYTVNSDGQWTVDGVIQKKGGNSQDLSSAGTSYADLLMEAARQSGVSPYVLAAMIIQEQGKTGDNPLISGTDSTYYGYYNFYNIGAYEHDGMTAVQAGLKYASESGSGNRPWNTVEKGIVGGAVAYGANFVDSGQDTFYLKKFNVQGNSPYTHQFMTNVIAASQEGSKLSSAYSEDIKNSALVFKIPVFKDMPETNCELPTATGNPNNKLNSLNVDGFTLTPSFNMNVTEYTLIIDSTVQGINVTAAAIDSRAAVNGTGYYELGTGLSEIRLTVTAENGTAREYKLSVTKKDGGAVSSGATSSGIVSGGSADTSGGPGVVYNNDNTSNMEISVQNPSSGQAGGSAQGTESSISIGSAPM